MRWNKICPMNIQITVSSPQLLWGVKLVGPSATLHWYIHIGTEKLCPLKNGVASLYVIDATCRYALWGLNTFGREEN